MSELSAPDPVQDPASGERDLLPDEGGVPLRMVLASMVILWAVYFAMATLRGFVLEFDYQEGLFARRFVVTLAGVAVTILVWLLLRGFDHRRIGLRILVAALASIPASLLLAAINQKAFADVEARIVDEVNKDQGISIRQDEAGNLLVDVPGISAGPEPPPSPPPVPPLRPDVPAIPEGVPPPVPPPRPPDQVAAGPSSESIAGEVRRGVARARTEASATSVRVEHSVGKKRMWQQLTDIALSRYFLLLSWCAVYIALGQAVQARLAERREGEYRRAAKAAELRSLRYQVNPHFLFNTLNSLSALVMTGRAEKAETMIQTISTFYRRSLSGDPTHDVPLTEEIELQRLYLQIEAVRFPERLRVAIGVPAALADARIPGMILQPLVENSVRYAVAAVSRPVMIALDAAEEHGQLVVTVADDGPGGAPDAGVHGFGIGLANVRDRLRARFGTAASMVSGPFASEATGTGWRTVLRLPLSYDEPAGAG